MRSYASHLLQHIGGNASQARLKCIAKCDAIPDKLCPASLVKQTVPSLNFFPPEQSCVVGVYCLEGITLTYLPYDLHVTSD